MSDENQKIANLERLKTHLLEGLDSGEPIEATEEWWREKQAELFENNSKSQISKS